MEGGPLVDGGGDLPHPLGDVCYQVGSTVTLRTPANEIGGGETDGTSELGNTALGVVE